jgi:hypothetical protein
MKAAPLRSLPEQTGKRIMLRTHSRCAPAGPYPSFSMRDVVGPKPSESRDNLTSRPFRALAAMAAFGKKMSGVIEGGVHTSSPGNRGNGAR